MIATSCASPTKLGVKLLCPTGPVHDNRLSCSSSPTQSGGSRGWMSLGVGSDGEARGLRSGLRKGCNLVKPLTWP
jgi:hypothetical protein